MILSSLAACVEGGRINDNHDPLIVRQWWSIFTSVTTDQAMHINSSGICERVMRRLGWPFCYMKKRLHGIKDLDTHPMNDVVMDIAVSIGCCDYERDALCVSLEYGLWRDLAFPRVSKFQPPLSFCMISLVMQYHCCCSQGIVKGMFIVC